MHIIRGTKVTLQWMDAASNSEGALDPGKKIKPETLGMIQETIGYLIHFDKKWAVLAMDRGADGTFRVFFEVPRSLVRQVRTLHEKKSKKPHHSKTT